MEGFLKLRNANPISFFNSTKKVIEQMTEVTKNHYLTPEILLQLVTPNCPLWRRDYNTCPFPDPFWAFYWPGGQALTRYLLDNKDIIVDRHVLDFGSGCGSLAIAAAKLDVAASITATDIDPIAAVAIELNALLNGCKPNSIRITTENMIGQILLSPKYNCILLGDMFYNDEFNSVLIEWLLNSFGSDVKIFIGDPGRDYKWLKRYKTFIEQVAEYKISKAYMELNDLTKRSINVWRLHPN